MASSYRSVASRSGPSEFSYNIEKRQAPSEVFYAGAAVAIACVAVGIFLSPKAIPLVFVLGCAAMYYWRRPKTYKLVLLVENNGVLAYQPSFDSPTTRVALSDLGNVVLESKIEVIDDEEVEVARIALETHDGRRFVLTYEFLSYDDTTEWLGKIRVFLHRNGWISDHESFPTPLKKT